VLEVLLDLVLVPEYVLMTYHWNMRLPQEDVLDDALPDFVVHVQVEADDHARDQDDGGAGDRLRLRRPVDLLELGIGLSDEAEDPVAAWRSCFGAASTLVPPSPGGATLCETRLRGGGADAAAAEASRASRRARRCERVWRAT
jgi:hypothetical protein